MLSQDFVLTIFEASLTGSGLVLALYALITPVLNRLFSWRLSYIELERRFQEYLTELERTEEQMKESFKKLKGVINDDEFAKIYDETRSHLAHTGTGLKETVEKQKYPRYLSSGFLIAFVGYIMSTLLSMLWLVNPTSPNINIIDEFIIPVFLVTTVVFLGVGVFSINDTYSVSKKEFEEIKERTKGEINKTKKSQRR